MRIALLTRTCGIAPAAIAWYTVDVLTRRIAANSRTETHRTDSALSPLDCTKDVPSGRRTAANRCEKGPPPSSAEPVFPASCESGRATAIHCESTVTPEARGSSPLHPASERSPRSREVPGASCFRALLAKVRANASAAAHLESAHLAGSLNSRHGAHPRGSVLVARRKPPTCPSGRTRRRLPVSGRAPARVLRATLSQELGQQLIERRSAQWVHRSQTRWLADAPQNGGPVGHELGDGYRTACSARGRDRGLARERIEHRRLVVASDREARSLVARDRVRGMPAAGLDRGEHHHRGDLASSCLQDVPALTARRAPRPCP